MEASADKTKAEHTGLRFVDSVSRSSMEIWRCEPEQCRNSSCAHAQRTPNDSNSRTDSTRAATSRQKGQQPSFVAFDLADRLHYTRAHFQWACFELDHSRLSYHRFQTIPQHLNHGIRTNPIDDTAGDQQFRYELRCVSGNCNWKGAILLSILAYLWK